MYILVAFLCAFLSVTCESVFNPDLDPYPEYTGTYSRWNKKNNTFEQFYNATEGSHYTSQWKFELETAYWRADSRQDFHKVAKFKVKDNILILTGYKHNGKFHVIDGEMYLEVYYNGDNIPSHNGWYKRTN